MSFLKNYMDFTAGSEVSDNYHFWSGIFALSALVNRRVWLSMGQYNLYPNLYVILLGPPGSGKDLAMDTARLIVEDVGNVKFSGDAQTKESLVRYMRDDCPVSIPFDGVMVTITPVVLFATELSHLLGLNSGHMIDFLTTIYTKDKRYVTKTKNKGDDIIERPFLGLLAGTTPDWITTYLRSDIIGGGFTRRVIFVNEPARAAIKDKTKRRPFIIVTPEQIAARQNVIAYGQTLTNVIGEFKWEPQARYEYEKWYMTRDIPDDPDVQGYFTTKPNQVLKVAMLVSLSQTLDLVIRKEHWDVAMALLDRTEVNLTRVFQGIGRNELYAIANKAVEFMMTFPEREYNAGADPSGAPIIRKARLVDDKKLRGYLYTNASLRECDDIINYLLSTEKIFAYDYTPTGGKQRRLYGLKV